MKTNRKYLSIRLEILAKQYAEVFVFASKRAERRGKLEKNFELVARKYVWNLRLAKRK